MNKIFHFILRPASVLFLLTILSCSPVNPATVNSPDCPSLIAELSTLNNDSKYTIPLWQNLVLLFSDQKLNEIKTSYDAVYIYLLGKYNIFTDQQELASLWKSQPERIIKSIQWEAYKQKLKRLAENRCRDSTNH
jgi:hypothetical protein